jgi:hypothetical protein
MSAALKSAEDDKQELLALLATTREQLLAALDGVSPALLERQTEAERWSVMQCAEHTMNAEEGMLRIWQKMAQPGNSPRGTDELIREKFNGLTKRKAPERVVPQGRITSVVEVRERFLAARAATIATVEQTGAEQLRGTVVPHPLVEQADGYQLFLIMALHARQHAGQISETANELAARERANG